MRLYHVGCGVVAVLALSPWVRAGVLYSDPSGGWRYTLNGNSAAPGSGGSGAFDALDGSWGHDNGSDAWDGSTIGAGRLGGLSALTDGPTNYIRIQDPGDPRSAPANQPDPSNRKLYLTRNITSELPGGYNILDQGVTLSFRARVSTGSPLDLQNPASGGSNEPGTGGAAWPAGGNGYLGHDGGKGLIGIRQNTGDKIISFSLGLDSDKANGGGGANVGAGLNMNSLNGASPSGNVDPYQNEGTLNVLGGFDPTQWHEFWITIQTGGAGTHVVNVYRDGALIPTTFNVTAGDGNEYEDSYIAFGMGATPELGAADLDFLSYKVGVFPP